MKNIINYFYYFISFAFLGYIWETIYTLVDDRILVNSGVLFGPYLPIYGIGGLVVYLLSIRIKNKFHLFCAAFILSSIIEYLTSYILEKLYNMSWWNYSSELFNINGRIYLLGIVVFAVMSLVAVYLIIPLLNRIKNRINPKVFHTIIFIIMIVFTIDLVYSLFINPNFSDAKIVEVR